MSNLASKFSPKAIVKYISLVVGSLAVIGGTAIALNWTFLRRVILIMQLSGSINPKDNRKPFVVYSLLLKIGVKLANKQVVASAWLDKMIQPSSVESSYGYHIWLQAKTKAKPGGIDPRASQPFLAKDTIYLDGASLQRVYIIPAHYLVVVRIGEQAEKWDDSVIPNTLVKSLSNLNADTR
jgi:hypothetical protein